MKWESIHDDPPMIDDDDGTPGQYTDDWDARSVNWNG
jgi:hypothetical protein